MSPSNGDISQNYSAVSQQDFNLKKKHIILLFNKLCLTRVNNKSLFKSFLLSLCFCWFLLTVTCFFMYAMSMTMNCFYLEILSWRIDLVLGLKLDPTREDLSLLQSSSFLALPTQVSLH